MAPKKSDSVKSANRIRLIVLDADLSDGNLSELTQAITNAIKPVAGTLRQLPPRPSGSPAAPPAVNGDEGEAEVESNEILDATADESIDEDAPRTPRPRPKLPVPTYLADLDITGNGTPFKEYATQNDPKRTIKRYLLAAKWLRDHGNSPTINTNKVYTLFRTAGWPVGIKDWDANFRSSVQYDYMQRKGPGEYILTPVGEGALQKTGD